MFDVLLVLLAVWCSNEETGGPFPHTLFIPVIFLLLVRLLPQLHITLTSAWLSESIGAVSRLYICAALGVLHWGAGAGRGPACRAGDLRHTAQ